MLKPFVFFRRGEWCIRHHDLTMHTGWTSFEYAVSLARILNRNYIAEPSPC